MQTTATNDSGHVAGGKTEADTSAHTAMQVKLAEKGRCNFDHAQFVRFVNEGYEYGAVAVVLGPENAARLVRTWNAHDGLVEALDWIVGMSDDPVIRNMARAALAKAGAA